MRLVVDANILVAELLRQRGRVLIVHQSLELYMAQKAWEEACYELSQRVAKMELVGRFSQDTGQKLLADAIALAEAKVSVIPHEVYATRETLARARIPRDPDDWPTVALALVMSAAIWTLDQDFLGCGLPTWTTDTLLTHLAARRSDS